MNTYSIIKDTRKQLGLTQTELVDLFNTAAPIDIQTSRASHSKYETGDITPKADVYLKMIDVLESAKAAKVKVLTS